MEDEKMIKMRAMAAMLNAVAMMLPREERNEFERAKARLESALKECGLEKPGTKLALASFCMDKLAQLPTMMDAKGLMAAAAKGDFHA